MKRTPSVILVSVFEKSDLTKTEKNRIWKHFMETGHSTHSARASILPFLVRKCEEEGIPYMIQAYPGKGYGIQKMDDLDA